MAGQIQPVIPGNLRGARLMNPPPLRNERANSE
jgi:hypothetical protein